MKPCSYEFLLDIKTSSNERVILEHLLRSDLPVGEGEYLNLSAATMVFDLAGSSLSIRERGSKEYFKNHQNIFRNLTKIIYDNHGIIEKFPGDGISMHFVNANSLEPFGAANCVRNAVTAATLIIDYLSQNEGLVSGFRLSLSYGDDTIAALIGGFEHEEWITIGHAVNVAHKLEKEIKARGCIFGMDERCHEVFTEVFCNTSTHCFEMPEELKKQASIEEFWYGVK
ncbi:hypothetical protein ABGV40_18155 [Paenibacillus amylolyticus]